MGKAKNNKVKEADNKYCRDLCIVLKDETDKFSNVTDQFISAATLLNEEIGKYCKENRHVDALDLFKSFSEAYSYIYSQYIFLNDGIVIHQYQDDAVKNDRRTERENDQLSFYCQKLKDKGIGNFTDMSVDGIINFVNKKKLKSEEVYFLEFESIVQRRLRIIIMKLRECAERIILTLKMNMVLRVDNVNGNQIALPIMTVDSQLLLKKGLQKALQITFSLPINIHEKFTSLQFKYKDINKLTDEKITTYQEYISRISTFANKYQINLINGGMR